MQDAFVLGPAKSTEHPSFGIRHTVSKDLHRSIGMARQYDMVEFELLPGCCGQEKLGCVGGDDGLDRRGEVKATGAACDFDDWTWLMLMRELPSRLS